jgi:hypothetical protein
MRNQWYGDGRDLIKWGVLVHLAEKWKLEAIIHVAYLRPNDPCPRIVGEEKPVALPQQVCDFFCRDIHDVKQLKSINKIRIEIFDEPFDGKDRNGYGDQIIKFIRRVRSGPVVVFLDPDTGIAEKNPKTQHVTPKDVKKIWKELDKDDWLILYQHALLVLLR